MPKPKPEAAARAGIDRALEASGWVIQDADELNLYAAPGVAVREFPMASAHGFADCLLFVDQKAVGDKDIFPLAVLKWAFEGKLVDQDPNDEPASALLERIRAEREATTKAKKRLDPKTKSESAPKARPRKKDTAA